MNPLMSAIGPMGNMQKMMQTISNLRSMMSGKNPDAVMRMMEQKNPQFAQFVKDNEGKSPEQIANDYGLDWGMIQGFLK